MVTEKASRCSGLILKLLIPVWIILFFLLRTPAYSQEKQDTSQTIKKEKVKISLRDPQTGAIDISDMILNARGFMPIPIFVTQPAVGYGGGLAILYLLPQKKKYDRYVPPNIYGVAGLGTQNKTWLIAGFAFKVWGPDRVRYLGAVARPVINIKYYGNNNEYLSENPVEVELNSWTVIQRMQVRMEKTKLFVGGSYIYYSSENTFDTLPDKPVINKMLKKLDGKSTLSMLQAIVNWDSRNTIFSPTKGINSGVQFTYNATWLGGDSDFYKLNPYFLGYLPVSKKVFSGWRFDASFMLGDAPFYALPFVQLRGVPAMQYQSDNTMVAETQWDFVVYKRWKVDVFTGMGKAFTAFDQFKDATLVYNYGFGFRYLLASKFGMDVGLDFAWSNNREFAFYLIVGSAWNK
jgi:hypothetical protein